MDAITNNDWPEARVTVKRNDVNVLSAVDVGTPTEPITLSETKTHLRVDHTDDDTYLTDTIKECRTLFERLTGIGLVSKTVTAAVRNQLGNVQVPYYPVASITSMVDQGGATLTSYDFFDYAYFRSPISDYFKVVYVTTATTATTDIKRALKQMVAVCYRHRGDSEDVDINKLLYQIAAPFKRGGWLY